jgi:hypothetical protein
MIFAGNFKEEPCQVLEKSPANLRRRTGVPVIGVDNPDVPIRMI